MVYKLYCPESRKCVQVLGRKTYDRLFDVVLGNGFYTFSEYTVSEMGRGGKRGAMFLRTTAVTLTSNSGNLLLLYRHCHECFKHQQQQQQKQQ